VWRRGGVRVVVIAVDVAAVAYVAFEAVVISLSGRFIRKSFDFFSRNSEVAQSARGVQEFAADETAHSFIRNTENGCNLPQGTSQPGDNLRQCTMVRLGVKITIMRSSA
jgi:hypothetical protein